MKKAAEFFLGSCAVYVVMAACSASGGGPDLGPTGEPPDGAGGQGGAPVAMAGASGRGSGAGGGVAQAGSGGQGAGGEGVAGMPGASGAAGAVAQGGSSGSPGSSGTSGAGGIFNPVPDADAATPGTRLKPKVFVGADGSKQPTTLWSDTQRGGEECSFRKAIDGVYRCLPTSIASTSGYFQNAGCTTPVLIASTTCAATAPAYIAVEATCGAGARVHERGPTIATAYSGTPGSCFPFSPSGFAFHTLGAEVPPASFVAAEFRTE